VFIDESGFLLQPLRKATWAPRGKTPVQEVSAKHNRRVSAIAALGWKPHGGQLSFNFQLTEKSFKTPKIIRFLKHLHRELGGPAIIVWDRLNAHKSAARYFREHHPDWFEFELLPGYSPHLNPVEALWGHTKHHDMPNLNPFDVVQLQAAVRKHLGRKRRRKSLFASFFATAELPL
jgi:transposase